jgi:hypothetical protein
MPVTDSSEGGGELSDIVYEKGKHVCGEETKTGLPGLL